MMPRRDEESLIDQIRAADFIAELIAEKGVQLQGIVCTSCTRYCRTNKANSRIVLCLRLLSVAELRGNRCTICNFHDCLPGTTGQKRGLRFSHELTRRARTDRSPHSPTALIAVFGYA